MKAIRFQLVMITMWVLSLAAGPGGPTQVAAQAGEPPAGPAMPQTSVNNGFTYQGQLSSGGTPLNGTCDMQFSLWDALAGPSQTGGIQTVTGIVLVDGKFTVLLNDAGQIGNNQFTGIQKWLQIAMRCPTGSGNYTTLAPRQPLSATPYAIGLKPGAAIDGSLGTELFGAYNNGAGEGLIGFSQDGVGVKGESATHYGVEAISGSGTAVKAESASSYGVYGISHTASGVVGVTDSTTGGFAGVYAYGAGYNTGSIALALVNGGIRVTNAGVNTDTPVFIHKVITGGGGSICTGGSWASVIDYPLINNNAGAILIVTANNGPYSGGTTPVNSVPAVFFDNTNFCGHGTGKWVIYNLGLAALPNNAMYNVFAIVP